MRKFSYVFAVVAVLWLAIAGGQASGSDSVRYVEGEVIVTFKDSLDLPAAENLLKRHTLGFAKHFSPLSKQLHRHIGLVREKSRTTAELVAELASEPGVATVEPNYLRWPSDGQVPRDPLFPKQWSLRNTGQVVQAMGGTVGADVHFLAASGLVRLATNLVVVAVIDSGVYFAHPDLVANMWVNPGEIEGNGQDDDQNGYVDDVHGYDFAGNVADPSDSGSHGTHVAGTIAAVGNNDLGVIGVEPNAKIMALKVSQDGENFFSSAIIEAVQYATMMRQRGVNVVAINASYGGPDSSNAERAAIQAAGEAGIVFCTAAGNDSTNNDNAFTYPPSYRLTNMLVVAATDQNDALASFSNYGASTVDLGAPGVNIISTIPPGITSYVHQASATYEADSLTFAGTTTGLTAAVYDCQLGYPADFPASVRGNIALIHRGTIHFSEKVSNAIAAGASGAIIYNNTNGLFFGTLEYSSNWIPTVAISQQDGLTMLANLASPATIVSATDPSVLYGYKSGTSMATPHVAAAVACAARNFSDETIQQRIQRVVGNLDALTSLQGKTISGGRLNLQRLLDTDLNGMADWWEKTRFGRLTGNDPNADPDGDGASNLQEFIADTNPTDLQSVLKLVDVRKTSEGIQVSWAGGTRAIQYLQRALAPHGPWVNLMTNQPPTTRNSTFLDADPSPSAVFYRVQVEDP